jgi:hypothetical protein
MGMNSGMRSIGEAIQTAEEQKKMWQKHRDLAGEASASADDQADDHKGVKDREQEQPGDDVFE